MSLILTAAVSVAASGLFVMNSSGLSLFYGDLPTEDDVFGHTARAAFSVLGITKWSWSILVIFALINTIFMTYRWLCISRHFKSLAERLDPAEQAETVTGSVHGEDREPDGQAESNHEAGGAGAGLPA
jgi:hypothetical protein